MLVKHDNTPDNVCSAEIALSKARTALNHITNEFTANSEFDLSKGITEEILVSMHYYPVMCTFIDIVSDYIYEAHEYVKQAGQLEGLKYKI